MFLANIVYNDYYKQPNVNVRINRLADTPSALKDKVVIENDGVAAANKFIFTLYPNSDIINFSKPFYTENLTVTQDGQRLLVANIPRLARGAEVVLNTNIKPSNSNITLFRVIGTYDQGSIEKLISLGVEQGQATSNTTELSISKSFFTDPFLSISATASIAGIAASAASSIFASGSKRKRIQNMPDILKRREKRFLSNIENEINKNNQSLENNIMHTGKLSSKAWNLPYTKRSKYLTDKKLYDSINEYYTQVNMRNFDFSQDRISSWIVKKHNQDCLRLSKVASETIQTKRINTTQGESNNE